MTKPPPTTSTLTVVLVLGAAALVGLLALPRFSADKLVGSQPRDFVLPRLETVVRGGDAGDVAKSPEGEKPVRLSDLAGKAVILDFWASWCLPCREQAPVVDQVARSLGGRGLVALGIVSDDDPEAALRFLAAHPVRYPSVVDEQDEAARAFDVRGLPTLVAIDREGRVVAVRRGLVREAELRGIAEAALKD
jgi:cytochrome c biogenesis protein CcmG/thiol:disulfide interchange protein DsbE